MDFIERSRDRGASFDKATSDLNGNPSFTRSNLHKMLNVGGSELTLSFETLMKDKLDFIAAHGNSL
jgi:hypothetical protein